MHICTHHHFHDKITSDQLTHRFNSVSRMFHVIIQNYLKLRQVCVEISVGGNLFTKTAAIFIQIIFLVNCSASSFSTAKCICGVWCMVLSNKFAKLLKCLVYFDADYLVLGLYAFLFRIWQLTCDTLKSCFLWQIHVYNIQWIAHNYNACIDFRTLFIPIGVIRCIKLFHFQFFFFEIMKRN